MSVPDVKAIARSNRQLLGLVIYRSLATFVLMVAAFSAFPEHRAVIALTIIVIGLGFSAVTEVIDVQRNLEAIRVDAADRQTRWTIFVAAERAVTGERTFLYDADGSDFWPEVKRRMRAEEDLLYGADDAKPLHWLGHVGLTIWNVLARLLGDLIAIGLATLFAGPSY